MDGDDAKDFHGCSRQRLLFEMMPKDGFHAGKRVGAEVQGARRSRFQPLDGMLAAQPPQTEAGTISHFRMRLAVQNPAEQLGSVWTGGLSPTQQTRRGPLQILLMGLGPVLGKGGRVMGGKAAHVAGHAPTGGKNLPGSGGGSGGRPP